MVEYAVLNDILDSIGPLDAGWMKKAGKHIIRSAPKPEKQNNTKDRQ